MSTEKDFIRKDVVKSHKRRNLLRRLPRYALFTVLLLLIFGGLFNYLANLPRERYAQGYGFFERVWLGTKKIYRMTSLSLNAHHPDPKSTRLQKVEIYIKGKRLDHLNENLPASGDSYQKAKVKLESKEYDADVKYRGDSMNHWAFPNKSWRVRLRKGKYYDGMNTFNLNVPRTDNQLANWLGYKMAEQFPSLITPEAKFVHFLLNRRYNGVRLFLEQPGQDFLARRNLPNGKIFIGDVDSSQIYGGVARKHLYKDTTAWQVRAPGTENPLSIEINPLIDTIKNEQNPYEFHKKMDSMIDMPSMLLYMALLEQVGTVHIDETHNGKFYFHPVTGKFMPIVWDTVAYFWNNENPIDLGSNTLFKVLLSNPDYREEKDRYLWEAVTRTLSTEKILALIDKERERIAPDMYAFALKIHANDKGIKHISNEEWEEAVTRLRQNVIDRNAYIEDTLRKTKATYNVVKNPAGDGKDVLAIQVRSHSGIKLNTIELPFEGGAQNMMLRRLGLEDIGGEVTPSSSDIAGKIVGDKIVFDLKGEKLYSKRSFRKTRNGSLVPGTYRYQIVPASSSSTPALRVPEIKMVAANSITGESYQPVYDSTLSVPDDVKKYAVWWDPELVPAGKEIVIAGDKLIQETLTVGPRDSLVIKPGATLKFAEGASLYIDRGSIVAEGTADRPITFTSSTPGGRWGVVAVREPQKASFAYVKASGASYDHLDFVRYDGIVSVHGGKAAIRNSEFSGGYLEVSYGELDIKDSVITNMFPFAIRSDNAYVKEEKVKRNHTQPTHSLALLDDKAHGTPDRIEREFKWSITPPEGRELTLVEVSEGIRAALQNSIAETPEVWKAPGFTGTQFYADGKTADFLFRDIYCDTPDDLLYQKGASYRFRNRYSKFKDYLRLMKQPEFTEVWPYRLEFQAKTNRKELGRGYSTVEEARFEFRKESEPFSATNPPPLAPWNIDEFLPYFQSGAYKGLTTYAAQSILREIQDRMGDRKEVPIEPRVVVLTERFRQHLNIASPWGSGPNPEQSYIISLDKSYIYDASTYLPYLRSAALGLKPDAPEEDASIIEIEIEFERNVSDVLDRKIRAATESGDEKELELLEGARDAFLADQETIMTVAQKSFAEQGIDLHPAQKSKYVQAFEMVFPDRVSEK